MRSEVIDWENFFEVLKHLMQPTVERVSNETDEHYREKMLKYMDKVFGG